MTTVKKSIKLPVAKPMTLLDFAELIVLSEKEKQDLQRQLNEIAAAVPARHPLLSVIKNLRAAALQARLAIKNQVEHAELCDNTDGPIYNNLKSALKSLEVHAV